MCAQVQWRPEKGAKSLGIEGIGGCELLNCGCWESKPSPLQKQQVILTAISSVPITLFLRTFSS